MIRPRQFEARQYPSPPTVGGVATNTCLDATLDAVSRPRTGPAPIALGRGTLSCEQVALIATERWGVRLAADALPRPVANHAAAVELATRTPVYGRSTAVGALLAESVGDPEGAAEQLLRSHAGTAGNPLPNAAVRAMVAVRIEQIAAGASGLGAATVLALVDGLNDDRMPVIGRYHSVGTGDITALARLGLTLPAGSLDPGDAMALMSSNALSLGRGCLAVIDLERLLGAAVVVTALSFLARDGAAGALLAAAAGPFPGPQRVARALRRLCPGDAPAGRLQDQYGLRAAPQTLGIAFDAAAALRSTVTLLSNAAAENPLIQTGPPAAAIHHGGFHAVHLTAALDAAVLALARAMTGSRNRTAILLEPVPATASNGPVGRAFLAAGPPTASGLMVGEYVASAALAAIRAAAVPAGLQTAELSRGVEQDAGFAPQSVTQLEEALAASRVVAAVELVAAVRSVRMRRIIMPVALRPVWELCGLLPVDLADRDLTDDLQLAEEILPRLAAFAGTSGDDEADPAPGRPPHLTEDSTP